MCHYNSWPKIKSLLLVRAPFVLNLYILHATIYAPLFNPILVDLCAMGNFMEIEIFQSSDSCSDNL